MSFNENIPNQDKYITGMEKSILDKALFMSHIDADIIIDFGCANGALIKFLSTLFPDKYFIGYDISYQMIMKAKSNMGNKRRLNVYFESNWEEVMKLVEELTTRYHRYKTCLVCSSVLHEVYSYSTKEEIDVFWDRFWNSRFDYIAVRDMYRCPNYMVSIEYDKARGLMGLSSYSNRYLRQYNDFVYEWGELKTINDYHHFFLKYFYYENWRRELKENYLPDDERIRNMVSTRIFRTKDDIYSAIFDIKYTLPYIKTKVEKDFNIKVLYPTHYQKIFMRR